MREPCLISIFRMYFYILNEKKKVYDDLVIKNENEVYVSLI